MPKAEPVAAETESAVLKKEIEGIAEDYLLFNMKITIYIVLLP